MAANHYASIEARDYAQVLAGNQYITIVNNYNATTEPHETRALDNADADVDVDVDIPQLQIQIRYTTKECVALKKTVQATRSKSSRPVQKRSILDLFVRPEAVSDIVDDDKQEKLVHELDRVEDFLDTLGFHLEEIEGQRITPNVDLRRPLSSLHSTLLECQPKIAEFGKDLDEDGQHSTSISQIEELCAIVKRLRLKLSTSLVVVTFGGLPMVSGASANELRALHDRLKEIQDETEQVHALRFGPGQPLQKRNLQDVESARSILLRRHVGPSAESESATLRDPSIQASILDSESITDSVYYSIADNDHLSLQDGPISGSTRVKIVVGIDFGTSYTGVSWAEKGAEVNIRVIDNWPGPASRTHARPTKVPSVIAYDGDTPTRWGFTVKYDDDFFRYLRIMLDPEIDRRAELLPQQLRMQAVTLIADYLRNVWAHTMRDLKCHFGPPSEADLDIDVIMTTPSVASDAARYKLRQAAIQAGIAGNISLITETEAAVIMMLKQKPQLYKPKVGDIFVLCDAGSRTVDVVSYEIIGLTPLRMRESVVSNGGLCGSVYIDMAFQKWVITKIGHHQWETIKTRYKRRMLTEFEWIKKDFGPGSKRTYTVDLYGVEDCPEDGIMDEVIQVRASVLQTIFDYVCSQVGQLVESQTQQLDRRGKTANAVLLVGGFSESDYLFDYIKSKFEQGERQVFRVDNASTAACVGATLSGLDSLDAATD